MDPLGLPAPPGGGLANAHPVLGPRGQGSPGTGIQLRHDGWHLAGNNEPMVQDVS